MGSLTMCKDGLLPPQLARTHAKRIGRLLLSRTRTMSSPPSGSMQKRRPRCRGSKRRPRCRGDLTPDIDRLRLRLRECTNAQPLIGGLFIRYLPYVCYFHVTMAQIQIKLSGSGIELKESRVEGSVLTLRCSSFVRLVPSILRDIFSGFVLFFFSLRVSRPHHTTICCAQVLNHKKTHSTRSAVSRKQAEASRRRSRARTRSPIGECPFAF